MIFCSFTQKLDLRFLILYPKSKEECIAIAKKTFLGSKAKNFL